MNKYQVTCFNGWTEKTTVRNVEAKNALSAHCSKKAVSNHMMANGWYVLMVKDALGNVLCQGKREECY